MSELIIGAVLGALTILSVIGIMVSTYLISQQRQLSEELDDLEDVVHEESQAFGDRVQDGFGALEGAIKSLAGKHGLVWDAEGGEWRKVQ